MEIFGYKLDFWLLFGFAAQGVFFMRFIVQWIESEKAKKSVIPITFWYLSIIGSVLILIYAIHRKDPVFILGQFIAMIIYVRNIILRNNQDK